MAHAAAIRGAWPGPDDELARVMAEQAGLESIEAQAKRMAGLVREHAREQQILQQQQRQQQHAARDDGDDDEGSGVHPDAGLLRRRARDDAWHAGVENGEGGAGLELAAPANRRRRRRRPHPYASVPYVVSEIMQWAHTFLTLKFVVYALLLDGLRESGYAFIFCVAYATIVLDRFKNLDGLGIGTMTNSYFIYRTTRELVNINTFVAAGLQIDISTEAMHVLCLAIVSFFAIQAACENAFLYYGFIVFWEFLLIPAVCYIRVFHQDFEHRAAFLSDKHIFWFWALFASVCLHPIDPYTLTWREKIHQLDRRLRVPYDPVLY